MLQTEIWDRPIISNVIYFYTLKLVCMFTIEFDLVYLVHCFSYNRLDSIFLGSIPKRIIVHLIVVAFYLNVKVVFTFYDNSETVVNKEIATTKFELAIIEYNIIIEFKIDI